MYINPSTDLSTLDVEMEGSEVQNPKLKHKTGKQWTRGQKSPLSQILIEAFHQLRIKNPNTIKTIRLRAFYPDCKRAIL